MSTYLITLTPIENFFFGSEKIGELGNRASYYVKSQRYPQQTAVLGMLRYVMLAKENKLGKNFRTDTSIKELIGERSFPHKDYGKIKSLSPVFIINEQGAKYFTAPMNYNRNFSFKNYKTSYGSKDEIFNMPFLENYDVKADVVEMLLSSGSNPIHLLYDKEESADGVFYSDENKFTQAGNQKNAVAYMDKAEKGDVAKRKKAKEEGYYKQHFMRMRPGFSFACYAEIGYDLDGYTMPVPFGGERSPFIITFSDTRQQMPPHQLYISRQPAVVKCQLVLLSDAHVDESILSLADFAITDSISFRNIQTTTSTTNYNRLSENNNTIDSPLISKRSMLLKKGSVLYFQNDNKMQEAQDKLSSGKEHFTQIGYNIFQTINTKTT